MPYRAPSLRKGHARTHRYVRKATARAAAVPCGGTRGSMWRSGCPALAPRNDACQKRHMDHGRYYGSAAAIQLYGYGLLGYATTAIAATTARPNGCTAARVMSRQLVT